MFTMNMGRLHRFSDRTDNGVGFVCIKRPPTNRQMLTQPTIDKNRQPFAFSKHSRNVHPLAQRQDKWFRCANLLSIIRGQLETHLPSWANTDLIPPLPFLVWLTTGNQFQGVSARRNPGFDAKLITRVRSQIGPANDLGCKTIEFGGKTNHTWRYFEMIL